VELGGSRGFAVDVLIIYSRIQLALSVSSKPFVYNIFGPIDSVFSLPNASFYNNSY
jgi:hypothetical protein